MQLKIHKDLYSSMNELYKSNIEIDLLTTTQKLRELKIFKSEYILAISKFSNNLGYFNATSILNSCDYEYRVRQMQILSRDFSNEVNGDQMSIDTCIEIGEKIKNQLIFNDQQQNESNEDIINDVV